MREGNAPVLPPLAADPPEPGAQFVSRDELADCLRQMGADVTRAIADAVASAVKTETAGLVSSIVSAIKASGNASTPSSTLRVSSPSDTVRTSDS